MGKSLYEQSPAAKAVYDEADRVLGWSLSKVCFEGPDAELTQTKVCQPALFVHGIAVLEALKEKGKLPEVGYALGLSLGEITAYTAAGVFDFATGLKVVAERGRLMQLACEASVGTMAAIVGQERSEIAQLCQEFDVEAANFNAPGQIIISGEKAKVEAAVAGAKAKGWKKVVPLNVAGAYHSRLMEPARVEFAKFLEGVTFNTPKYKVFTNTTGQELSQPAALREALVKQVVSSVLWEDCMRSAAAAGATEYWELGVGGVLAGLCKRIDKAMVAKSFAEAADVVA